MKREWIERPDLIPARTVGFTDQTRCYRMECRRGGDLRVYVTPDGPGDRWHLSISHGVETSRDRVAGRLPTWREIRDARYRFVPDEVRMVMHLPPRSEYVNVMATCFHLHEITEEEAVVAPAWLDRRTRPS